MILQAYSALDKKVGAFMSPLWFRSRGEAMRSFMDACQSADSQFFKHPEDYVFLYICSFDDENGTVTFPKEGPEPIITGLDCVKRDQ